MSAFIAATGAPDFILATGATAVPAFIGATGVLAITDTAATGVQAFTDTEATAATVGAALPCIAIAAAGGEAARERR